MRRVLMMLFILIIGVSVHIHANVVLSEIMFNPAGSEYYDEYIELYNNSETTVDLTNWKISDGTGESILIQPNGETTIIAQPHQFILVLDSGYFEHSTQYNPLPDNALVITVNTSSFGSGGFSNSSPETVSLIDGDGNIVESYTYSIDNDDGYSDEKIDLSINGNDSNWANSTVFNGTPGTINSVSPKNYDLSISVDDFSFLSNLPLSPNENIECNLLIHNNGINAYQSGNATLFITIKTSGNEETSNLSIDIPIEPLSAENFVFNLPNLDIGTYVGEFAIEYNLDEVPNNNNITIPFMVGESPIVFNEIMYNPDGCSEWIELYNRANYSVDLTGFSITDASGNNVILSAHNGSEPILLPNSYCVVISDSINLPSNIPADVLLLFNLPSLNNSGDSLALSDSNAVIYDAMYYHSNWGGDKGISLERISYLAESNSSTNWGSCIDTVGNTLGKKNSISPPDVDVAIDTTSVNISYQNSMINLSFNVINKGFLSISSMKIKIFNDENLNNELDDGENIWVNDVANEQIQPLDSQLITENFALNIDKLVNIGVKIEVDGDEDLTNNCYSIQYIVSYNEIIKINEIMYSTDTNGSDWIELKNVSDDVVSTSNLNVQIGDDTYEIGEYLILPDSFIVIVEDKDKFLSIFSVNTDNVVECISDILSGGEEIKIVDKDNNVLDRVNFSNSWGGGKNISLEKINPEFTSNDENSWGSCFDVSGGTPLKKNSIYVDYLPSDVEVSVSPNPFSPDNDGYNDFTLINYHSPAKNGTIKLDIYDIKGRLVRTLRNQVYAGLTANVRWDGKNDNGEVVRMGIYIIYVQVYDENNTIMYSAKKSVVVAKKM